MNYIKETVNILKNLNNLKRAEENLILRLKECRENLTSVKAITISDMPSGSRINPPDEGVCNLLFEEKMLITNLKKTKASIKKIEKLKAGLTEEELRILELAYAEKYENLTDEAKAKKLNISRRTFITKKSQVTKKFAMQLWGIAVI